MPPQPYIVHPTDLQYVPTIMRAPSPSSTIGTEYGQDETSIVDSELSERDFGRKCDEIIGLHNPRPDEEQANRDPLVVPHPRTRTKLSALEEKYMFEQVMKNLRAAVERLDEDDLFEQNAIKTAALALDDPVPSTDDVDAIMQSLMSLSPSSPSPNATGTATAHGSARFTARSETVTPQRGPKDWPARDRDQT